MYYDVRPRYRKSAAFSEKMYSILEYEIRHGRMCSIKKKKIHLIYGYDFRLRHCIILLYSCSTSYNNGLLFLTNRLVWLLVIFP